MVLEARLLDALLLKMQLKKKIRMKESMLHLASTSADTWL